MTGVNRATITRLARELIKYRLVREAGHQSFNAGRPSILLQLDPDAGWVICAESEVEVGSIILKEFIFPIYVNNKANMAALAESYVGSAYDSQYIFYLSINAEVSAGVIISQRILTGVSGLAGEVGHMTIDPRGLDVIAGAKGVGRLM
jgi:predicted NBD/HSP70 family sugar kinase